MTVVRQPKRSGSNIMCWDPGPNWQCCSPGPDPATSHRSTSDWCHLFQLPDPNSGPDPNRWIRHLWRIRKCKPEEANCLCLIFNSCRPDYGTGCCLPGLFRVVVVILRVRIRWWNEWKVIRKIRIWVLDPDPSAGLGSGHSAAFYALKTRNPDVWNVDLVFNAGSVVWCRT